MFARFRGQVHIFFPSRDALLVRDLVFAVIRRVVIYHSNDAKKYPSRHHALPSDVMASPRMRACQWL